MAPGLPVAVREHAGVDHYRRLQGVVSSYRGPVRTEHDPGNPGFGAGCNALAAGSTAEWFAFLNPDTELLTWPWRSANPPRDTIVGPVMDADPAAHYGRRYRLRDEIRRSWLRSTDPAPDGTGFVSGAALLVDADSFHRVGGFDPGYFMFYEDIDLCLRANDEGIATEIEPAWTMHHERAHSTSERFGDSLLWSYESATRFHRAHGSSLPAYRAYLVADSALRLIVHTLRRDRRRRDAYAVLARRAGRDLIGG